MAKDIRDVAEREKLAMQMVKKGFKNGIIELATDLKTAKVRQIRNDLNANETVKKRGNLKVPARIVNNRRRMIDGGIFIQMYLMMADNASVQIDFRALIEAYDFYIKCHQSIYTQKYNELDINEAYVLVRDYRRRQGIVELHSCNCGCDYIVVAEQRMRADCPICNLESKDGRNNKASLEEDDEDEFSSIIMDAEFE